MMKWDSYCNPVFILKAHCLSIVNCWYAASFSEAGEEPRVRNGCTKCRWQKPGCGRCRPWADGNLKGYYRDAENNVCVRMWSGKPKGLSRTIQTRSEAVLLTGSLTMHVAHWNIEGKPPRHDSCLRDNQPPFCLKTSCHQLAQVTQDRTDVALPRENRLLQQQYQ